MRLFVFGLLILSVMAAITRYASYRQENSQGQWIESSAYTFVEIGK